MKVTVKKLPGNECVVDVMPTDTVLQLKQKVSDLLQIEVPQQKLLHIGKTLIDENPLSFYPAIEDGSKLHLIVKKAEEGSSKGSTPVHKTGINLLKDEMTRVLRYYYTYSDTETIVNEVIKNLKYKVKYLSYDDLERLATALLQDETLKQMECATHEQLDTRTECDDVGKKDDAQEWTHTERMKKLILLK